MDWVEIKENQQTTKSEYKTNGREMFNSVFVMGVIAHLVEYNIHICLFLATSVTFLLSIG